VLNHWVKIAEMLSKTNNKMGEKVRTFLNLNIPVGVFGIIVTVMLAFVAFTVNVNAKNNKIEVKVETLEKTMETKADKKDIEYIKEMLQDQKDALKRIDDNLQKHMTPRK
jgi:5-bromo-4-chloroindolyl phosphate hydrolysis protein